MGIENYESKYTGQEIDEAITKVSEKISGNDLAFNNPADLYLHNIRYNIALGDGEYGCDIYFSFIGQREAAYYDNTGLFSDLQISGLTQLPASGWIALSYGDSINQSHPFSVISIGNFGPSYMYVSYYDPKSEWINPSQVNNDLTKKYALGSTLAFINDNVIPLKVGGAFVPMI